MQKHLPLKIFALLVVVGILLLPTPTGAVVKQAVAVVVEGVVKFYGVIVALEAAIVQWLLDPKVWDEAFTKNPTIIRAWRVLRDFANLGFVLALVVIAIGFILRLQTYGSQRTLTRLIVAAILVNFSLVIAGVFIDVANVVTRFFLEGFKFNNIAASLLDATSVPELVKSEPNKPLLLRAINFFKNPIKAIKDDFGAAGEILFKFLLLSIFTVMLIAALGALAVMLLIRVAHLWVLLVLAPLAWLLWIFPQFESNWRRWWTEFLRWTFFAPIVTFFLALSVTIVRQTSDKPASDPSNFIGAASSVFGDVFKEGVKESGDTPNAIIARFTIALALVVMSMIIADQMSISFADQGVRWTTGIARWPSRQIVAGIRASLREGRQRLATSRVGQRVKERFAGSPVLGGITRRIQELEKEAEGDIARARAELAVIQDPRRVAEIARRHVSKNYRVAASLKLAEDDPRLLSAFLTPSERQARFNEAYSISPELAEKMLASNPFEHLDTYNRIPGVRGMDMRRAQRMIPDDKAAEIYTTSVLERVAQDLELLTNMSMNAIKDIVERGSAAQRARLQEIYQDIAVRASLPAGTAGAINAQQFARFLGKLRDELIPQVFSEAVLSSLKQISGGAPLKNLVIHLSMKGLQHIHDTGDPRQVAIIAEALQDIYTDPATPAHIRNQAAARLFNPYLSAFRTT